jgi:hypothetical protein
MRGVLRRVGRPWVLTLGVIALYLAVLLLDAGCDPLVFVRVGTRFSERTHSNAQDPQGSTGYDGQFYYYMAQDLAQGWRHMDVPAYRYQRVLYPLVVRFLSLPDERLLPWAMVWVNLVSVSAGVAIVEGLLVAQGISRWYALPVGLFAGQVFPVAAALAEPLALCLALAAVLLFARGRWLWSAILFALAALTKETHLILVAAYVAYMLRQGQAGRALTVGAIAGAPFGVWQAILRLWLGAWGLGAGGAGATPFQYVPFGALLSLARVSWAILGVFAAVLVPIVIVPTVWAIGTAGRAILAGENHPWTYALLLYAAVIPFLPASTLLDLSAMPRFASPLVALTILCAARCRSGRVLRASLLWMTTLVLVPFL